METQPSAPGIAIIARLLLVSVALFSATLHAEEEPPTAEPFLRAPFIFKFVVPGALGQKLVEVRTEYMNSGVGKVPYQETRWELDLESVVHNHSVPPDSLWKSKTPEQMLGDPKAVFLRNPGIKLLSERDYKIGELRARSYVLSIAGEKPEFRRMDYVLNQPSVHVVMFTAPTREAIDGPGCSALYESFTVKPRPAK